MMNHEQMRCTKCRTSRALSEFRVDKARKSGINPICKSCSKEYRKLLLLKDPQYDRKSNLKRRSGMTPEWYKRLFDHSDGKCWICLTPQKDLKRALSVDHDHKNGKIRGLLCVHCNLGIGSMKESPQIMYAAVYYINHFNGLEGFD